MTTVAFKGEVRGAMRMNNRIISIFSFFPFYKHKKKNKLD